MVIEEWEARCECTDCDCRQYVIVTDEDDPDEMRICDDCMWQIHE